MRVPGAVTAAMCRCGGDTSLQFISSSVTTTCGKTFSLKDKMPFETKRLKSTSISVHVKHFPAAQTQTRDFDEHDEETERPRVRSREQESHPGMTLAS